MSDYDGFVYIWFDIKRKLFCVGSHYGSVDDGYITSTGHMPKAYKKRSNDFKRKILEYHIGDPISLYQKEQYWLNMIKDDELYRCPNEKYYNRKKNAMGISGEYASKLRKEYYNSPAGIEHKKQLSEKMKGNKFRKGHTPWNKEKTCESISIGRLKNPIIWNDEMKEKQSILINNNWKNGKYNNRPKMSEYTKEKIKTKNSGKKRSQIQKEKIAKSLSSKWMIIDPNGNSFLIENRNKFAKEMNLDASNLGCKSGSKGYKSIRIKDINKVVT